MSVSASAKRETCGYRIVMLMYVYQEDMSVTASTMRETCGYPIEMRMSVY